MFNCTLDIFLFNFNTSHVLVLRPVKCLSWGCSYNYRYHYHLRYLHPGLPDLLHGLCWILMSCCSDVAVLLLHGTFNFFTLLNNKDVFFLLLVTLLLVTSSEGVHNALPSNTIVRSSTAAVQCNVCNAKGVCTIRPLAISAKFFAAAFECLLVWWHNKERKKKSKLWPYYYYYYYYY